MADKEKFRKLYGYEKGMLISFKDRTNPNRNEQLCIGTVIDDSIMYGLTGIAVGGRYWYRVFSDDKMHMVPAEHATRI